MDIKNYFVDIQKNERQKLRISKIRNSFGYLDIALWVSQQEILLDIHNSVFGYPYINFLDDHK